MAGYCDFAAVYDLLTQNVPYDEIAAYYDNILQGLGAGRLLLDMGCGTGNLTIRLAGMGYDVIASDASVEMLSAAQAKPQEGVRWICQSMTETELYGAAEAAVSTLDSINHLASTEEMGMCFERLAQNMEKGGIFAFDVNTIYKHREILADNTFIYDVDGAYCAWQNSFNPNDGSVDIELDLFIENKDGSYSRGFESFREIAAGEAEIRALLERAGFKTELVYDYLTYDPPRADSEKLLFAARKM